MAIRLMIIDDHDLIREGLVKYLGMSPDIEVVAEGRCGDELLNKLRTTPADLLLLDMNMPGICGTDLIRLVKGIYPALRILVLSMHDEMHVVSRAMKAGASGYICKCCTQPTLLEAIRKVSATGKYLNPEMAEQIAFAGSSPETKHDDLDLLLSDRELQIFNMIVDGKSIKEIAYELAISDKTVSTHKGHLLGKLGLNNVPDLVRYAMQAKMFS